MWKYALRTSFQLSPSITQQTCIPGPIDRSGGLPATTSRLVPPKAFTTQLSKALEIKDQNMAIQKKYRSNIGENLVLVAMMPTP